MVRHVFIQVFIYICIYTCQAVSLIWSLFKQNIFKRNGADFSVFINTASEFDGSDAGASPDEAISWGKIKRDAKPVKVNLKRKFLADYDRKEFLRIAYKILYEFF